MYYIEIFMGSDTSLLCLYNIQTFLYFIFLLQKLVNRFRLMRFSPRFYMCVGRMKSSLLHSYISLSFAKNIFPGPDESHIVYVVQLLVCFQFAIGARVWFPAYRTIFHGLVSWTDELIWEFPIIPLIASLREPFWFSTISAQ